MGEIEVVEYKKKFKKDWDEFLKRVGFGEITFTTDFLEIIESEYGYKPLHHIAYKNGEVVGIFPAFLVKGLFGGRKIVSLPFSERGGIVCVNSCEKQMLSHFISAIKEEKNLQYVEIRAPINTNHLSEFGFRENTNYNYCTFLIDLTKPLEEIWRKMDKGSVRWAVKKAMKSGVKVVHVNDVDGLRSFYNLYLKTMKYHGSPPHRFRYFKKLFDVFNPTNMRITLAMYNEEAIGGMLCFMYNGKVQYSFGVSRTEYIKLNPNNLLIWEMLQWSKGHEYKIFDFGRTRKGSGVYNFKKRWGGIEKELPYYIKLCRSSKMPYIDPMNRKYRLLARLWSKLPITFTKIFGPLVRGRIT